MYVCIMHIIIFFVIESLLYFPVAFFFIHCVAKREPRHTRAHELTNIKILLLHNTLQVVLLQ